MNNDDPRLDNVVCEIARVQYAAGHNGIEIAEMWVSSYATALLEVHDGRRTNPSAFPGFGDGTPEETARRIIARLLDAGWRPPDADCLEVTP
jgi:hypothetical protein